MEIQNILSIIQKEEELDNGNRKNINPDYKAQRATSRITHWGLYDTKEQETEALIGQLYRVQDYIECLPMHQIGMEKLEEFQNILSIIQQEEELDNGRHRRN